MKILRNRAARYQILIMSGIFCHSALDAESSPSTSSGCMVSSELAEESNHGFLLEFTPYLIRGRNDKKMIVLRGKTLRDSLIKTTS